MERNILKAKIGKPFVFNVRDVISTLRKPPIRHDTKAVLNPSESIAKELLPGMSPSDYVNTIKAGLRTVKEYDVRVWRIGILQLAGSLRISEALEIMPWNITLLGDVKITAKKRGIDRIVQGGEIREWLIFCRDNSIVPFDGISKNYVWRVYNKCGLVAVVGNKQNHQVTHIFRHANASVIRESNLSDDLVTQQLGHKSKNTQSHYGKA